MRYAWTFLLSMILIAGCRQSAPLAQDWSTPIKITETIDSLTGGITLYNWQSRIIALQPQNDRSAKCFMLNSNGNSWSEVSFTGVPHHGYFLPYLPETDSKSEKVLFDGSYTESNQLTIATFTGRLLINENVAVQDASEKKWIVNKELLRNVGTVESDRRECLFFGIINGQDLYFPYSFSKLDATQTHYEYANGIFHSPDLGTTWQIEKTPESLGNPSSVVETESYLYCIAGKFVMNQKDQLWASRKAGNSWDIPEAITKTFAHGLVALAENDTVHLCWLDNRHEKRALDIGVFPPHLSRNLENSEVAYSHRKNSDKSWSKEIILSKGLFDSFSPSMSVDGNKIVIAWAGVQAASNWHSDFDPNDIYYVTSKDGGKTWAKLLRVTDNIKEGITAGDPHVILKDGIIHLTYIQGKMNLKQEMAGLVKLNQPPWPIYYQQMPFPN